MIKKYVGDFKDLLIWQKSIKLFEMIVSDCQKFPRNRISFIISDQVIRSVASVSANIAEGFGRGTDKEILRFCRIARGSISESRDWIFKIRKMKYITSERFIGYEKEFRELSKMLNVFMSKVRKRIKS